MHTYSSSSCWPIYRIPQPNLKSWLNTIPFFLAQPHNWLGSSPAAYFCRLPSPVSECCSLSKPLVRPPSVSWAAAARVFCLLLLWPAGQLSRLSIARVSFGSKFVGYWIDIRKFHGDWPTNQSFASGPGGARSNRPTDIHYIDGCRLIWLQFQWLNRQRVRITGEFPGLCS